jgi:hypothetical protein
MLAAGTYKEGDYVYDGEWHEDIIQGMGKFTYASGACYEVCQQGFADKCCSSSSAVTDKRTSEMMTA